jgi:hypothetical protein
MSGYKPYLAFWMAVCLVAGMVYLRKPSQCLLSGKPYWEFLFVPWKILTFLASALFMIVIAPHTGDPTWDYWDAGFMAALTFLTAPWSVGVLYRSFGGQGSFTQSFLAVCVWFFSVSWSYDLYLLLRDGAYPVTWLTNLFASSGLYFLGGFLWSLEWRPNAGIMLAFKDSGWPVRPKHGQFRRLWPLAFSIIAFVGGVLIWGFTQVR